jgi:hypothetical protein
VYRLFTTIVPCHDSSTTDTIVKIKILDLVSSCSRCESGVFALHFVILPMASMRLEVFSVACIEKKTVSGMVVRGKPLTAHLVTRDSFLASHGCHGSAFAADAGARPLVQSVLVNTWEPLT